MYNLKLVDTFELNEATVGEKLALSGPMSLRELTISLGLDPRVDGNAVMGCLVALQYKNKVTYDLNNGTFTSLVVLK